MNKVAYKNVLKVYTLCVYKGLYKELLTLMSGTCRCNPATINRNLIVFRPCPIIYNSQSNNLNNMSLNTDSVGLFIKFYGVFNLHD